MAFDRDTFIFHPSSYDDANGKRVRVKDTFHGTTKGRLVGDFSVVKGTSATEVNVNLGAKDNIVVTGPNLPSYSRMNNKVSTMSVRDKGGNDILLLPGECHDYDARPALPSEVGRNAKSGSDTVVLTETGTGQKIVISGVERIAFSGDDGSSLLTVPDKKIPEVLDQKIGSGEISAYSFDTVRGSAFAARSDKAIDAFTYLESKDALTEFGNRSDALRYLSELAKNDVEKFKVEASAFMNGAGGISRTVGVKNITLSFPLTREEVEAAQNGADISLATCNAMSEHYNGVSIKDEIGAKRPAVESKSDVSAPVAENDDGGELAVISSGKGEEAELSGLKTDYYVSPQNQSPKGP